MMFRAKVWQGGEVRRIQIHAADALSAARMFETRGRVLGKVKTSSPRSRRSSSIPPLRFAEELLTLLKAGLSLVESLDILVGRVGSGNVLSAAALQKTVMEGRTLSQALNESDFPSLLVALVQSSEQTGDLAFALERYVAHEKRATDLKRKVSSAITYPSLLALTGVCVVGFLLFYVLPRFSRIFEDLGDRLSLAARLMLWWSHLIDGRAALAIGIMVILSLALVATVLDKRLQNRLMQLLFRLPRFGSVILTYRVANAARTLAMLGEGGIPLTRGLRIAAESTTDTDLQRKLGRVAELVSEGRTLSSAFVEQSLGDEVAVRLIAVGERSGDLALALSRIADLYDAQISGWIDRFVRLFEPALMLAIGLVVGTIVVLMYLPIFELAGSLQ